MAIDQKEKPESAKPKPLVFRDNPEVKAKIEAHKKANPEKDFVDVALNSLLAPECCHVACV